ncbi:MAG: class I SAM-dependent methyltransferase [Nitrososphaerales archaeon]
MDENDFAYLLMSEERKKWQDPQKILEELGIAENANSADLACGPGFFTIPLAQMARGSAIVYAVDQSAVMLSHLERNLKAAVPPETLQRVKIIQGDVTRTTIPGESVSLVFFAQILHDLENHKTFFDEIKRISQKECRIVDIDWHKRNTNDMGPPVEIRLSENEARKILRDNGFQIVHALNAGPHHYGLVAKRR